ncbi:pyridoxamine 5'-phosphate oxidase family protein [Paraburkholderia acidisoli]|uniref:Pyridoxamine 5-phosphate oxidase n=1 Tax=Paraburkholderia acidisoli TaxID=2571748 RepID=A0A7Z2GP75_9BURK|nr:pyridoxamine 5'-phosphate oxidase family protein [Paraburkholderia acidisoli]QGZ65343.1 pyridoxamine 5-phosphate oxidase [Paraburkholderia acidisoli]
MQNGQNAAHELPRQVVEDFNGNGLEARLGDAFRLSTVGEDGWPHAAQLSVGEILAVSAVELLVAVWPNSHTAGNLKRDGKLTLSLVHDGALLEIRATARMAAEQQTALGLTVFRVTVAAVNEHRAKYAEVTSGVTFRLHDPQAVLARWREQIAMLRAI